jgi:amino acid permease
MFIKLKILKINLAKIPLYKILLYYSVLLSTILIIGGFYFYLVKSEKEIINLISNLLFFPVAIFLWITLLLKKRKRKKSETKIIESYKTHKR